jgi:hypothetical protein
MTNHQDKSMPRKRYERPLVRRVKLETIEATLGTGCQNPPVSSASGEDCQQIYTPCDVQ